MREVRISPSKTHKRECHKCRYNGKGDAICLTCPGPAELSCKGVSFVFLDDLPDPEGMIDKRIDDTPDSMMGMMTLEEDRAREPRASREIPHVSKLDGKLEEELVPIIADFIGLGLRHLVVLRSFWRGEDCEAGAKALGLSCEAFNVRLAEIREKCPEVMRVCVRERMGHMADGPVEPNKATGRSRSRWGWLQ